MEPTVQLQYFGIILDIERMEARLPNDKLSRIITILDMLKNKHSISKREMLSLLGHLISSVSNALGCDVVLGSVVDQLWDMSINKSTRTVYEAGFRAFRRFSDMYPSGSLSPTHPTISEEILSTLWHTVLVSYS